MPMALDVARYIINYSNKKEYSTSNLKLQKLLYFVQAYFLSFTPSRKPCFEEEIEAWDFGPVVPSVYHEFKSFGGNSIPVITSYYKFNSNNSLWSIKKIAYDPECISKEERKIIESVVDKFAPYSASSLVSLTHNQTPWKKAYQPHHNNIISKKSIQEYFDG